MEGTARRPETRLAAADTQETLVRPALWALSGRDEDADQPETHFRITLPTATPNQHDALSLDEADPDDAAALPISNSTSGTRIPARWATLNLPKRRGVWAVCATLLLITLSGVAFAAFPSGGHRPMTSGANAIGRGAVTDDPQEGALALGKKGAAMVVSQTSPVSSGTGAPCVGPVLFPAKIDTWTVPAGCYGLIYTPNPANYVSRPGFGYCNWWVRVMDSGHPDITENTSYPRGSMPRVGAAVYFDGGVQGADPAGHWARVEAIAPDGYWMLISEMNFAWRGGGFGRVDYRFAHTGPGVTFIYA